jgi:hypothetical protein
MTAAPRYPAILLGRRRFAWRPVRLEDGRRTWLRLVFRLEPVCGIRPCWNGRPVVHTDRLPHCDPGLGGWLRAGPFGKAWRMRKRFLGYLLLWLLVLAAITELVGWIFVWPSQFGGLQIGGTTLYLPGSFLSWRGLLRPDDRWIVDAAGTACALAGAAVLVRIWLDVTGTWRPRRRFGAERWASGREVRRSGLVGRRR